MTTSASAYNGNMKKSPLIKHRSHRSTKMIVIFENAQLIRTLQAEMCYLLFCGCLKVHLELEGAILKIHC